MFIQSTPATTWNIPHNLGYRYVQVEPIDSSNNSFVGRYDYPTINFVDSNNLTLTFSTAQSGYANVSSGGGQQGPQGATGSVGPQGATGAVISGASGISYTPNNPTVWSGTPPNNVQDAIDRIAYALYLSSGVI